MCFWSPGGCPGRHLGREHLALGRRGGSFGAGPGCWMAAANAMGARVALSILLNMVEEPAFPCFIQHFSRGRVRPRSG